MANDVELVQILIPCFNGKEYLEETLVSIQNQTHTNFDCLMIDDGSSDDSSSIFSRFAKGDPRFRLVVNEKNQGESYAVNVGWRSKKGKLICVLSFDDPQPHDWLEKMMKFRSENPGFIIYYPNRLVINESGISIRHEVLFDWSKSLLRDDLLCIVSVGAVIDSELLPSSFEPRIQEIVFPSDLVQYLKLSEYGDGIRHPSYFCVWRAHEKGKSADESIVLAKEFAVGMHIFLNKNIEGEMGIQKSAIFAHIVHLLQGKFSLPVSLVLGLRIFLGEFELRSIRVTELFEILIRFRQRRHFHQIDGF
jgi:glycosyltransferase involved in cell wall biosynthesis